VALATPNPFVGIFVKQKYVFFLILFSSTFIARIKVLLVIILQKHFSFNFYIFVFRKKSFIQLVADI